MDIILILSRDAYYVARYDDDVDKVTQYQRVALADVEKIEFGALDQPTFQVFILFWWFSFRESPITVEDDWCPLFLSSNIWHFNFSVII